MKVSIDLAAFRNALEDERRKFNEAARPAAQAGADVIYNLARIKVPVSSKSHWFHGSSFKKTGQKYFFTPGSLRDSIYQVYSKANSNEAKATYHVSWNRTKAPYAWMVEFGTSRAPAHPFMRPAIIEGRKMAAEAVRVEFVSRVRA